MLPYTSNLNGNTNAASIRWQQTSASKNYDTVAQATFNKDVTLEADAKPTNMYDGAGRLKDRTDLSAEASERESENTLPNMDWLSEDIGKGTTELMDNAKQEGNFQKQRDMAEKYAR